MIERVLTNVLLAAVAVYGARLAWWLLKIRRAMHNADDFSGRFDNN